jgi:lysozyme
MALKEGYSDQAIIPVRGDVATICFGATEGVKLGDKSHPVACLERFGRDVTKYEAMVKECVKVPLAQREYDAFVDLAYNVGKGKVGVKDGFCYRKEGGYSSVVRKVNAGDYEGACEAILNWKMYQGKDCSKPENKRLCGGIWTRRLEARAKCLGL